MDDAALAGLEAIANKIEDGELQDLGLGCTFYETRTAMRWHPEKYWDKTAWNKP